MGLLNFIKWRIKDYIRIRNFRNLNSTNFVELKSMVSNDSVHIGNYTYGTLNISTMNSGCILRIGAFCSIGPDVLFIGCAEHNTKLISTYPFLNKLISGESEALSKGDIIVDDDVWIGQRATIMSGVHIGQGAVVAAGAVVTKDVPPYAIVGGVPARVIKYRFEPEMIEELLKIDYSKLTKEDIEKHIDELYVELKDMRQLDWMPKKGE